ncbi:MAG TPA: MFS transporter [Candidatus Methylacidiphilales bacterium]|jgi:MFS family permease|nr:MFS transporter [Candidatus Methylacidiphilales bacterium]
MAQRQEIAAVYSAGVIQGIVLVTFPAVSAIFMSAAHYGLSTTEYGGMFAPQAATAILSSLLGAGLTRRIGGKCVFLIGLAADLLSMALLFVSQFATGVHPLAYGLLLAATACLGVGFGFVVPSINTFTAAFFPKKVDQAILALNALLGLGTALAPIFAAIFVGLGFWWGLPILMSGLTLALILPALRLPLETGVQGAEGGHAVQPAAIKIPARFRLYAAFALLYGICETMNGNWATVYMSAGLGASTAAASMALTVFWGAVTGGRVLFAVIGKWCPPRWTYRALPLVVALAFVATASAPADEPFSAILAFGLAGLGCSALLPLVISFGQEELTTMTASVAGGMIGFYQIGYGMAAFGVGPLQAWGGLSLAGIYRGAALFALALAALAFVIVGRARRGEGRGI